LPTPVATDEKDLLERLRDGDEYAFNLLFKKYNTPLTGHLLRLLKSPELVEDVLQDTFMSLWVHRTMVDVQKPVKAYLFQIAINNAKNLFKKAAHDEKMRAYFYPVLEAGYEHIESKLFQEENKQMLNRLLDLLPPKQKTVYTLCKLDGLSYKEVSEKLGISESTVNSHILRANLFLKSHLIDRQEVITWLLVPALSGVFLA
jgi:RNA polymerase sigma-70 factor (family 1)